jgi:hypothetical protein
MIIEYKLPCRRLFAQRALTLEPFSEPYGRPPRLARLVALAHKLEGVVQSGQVKDYAGLARLGHVSAARLSQIMVLARLAPAIQEYILFLPENEAGFLQERQLRAIAREPRWDRQREIFKEMLRYRR